MDNVNDDPKWFCLRSQPKHEHIAAARLRTVSDVEVFCPRVRMQKATVTGSKWFVEGMFPGYLFARFPFAARHKEVRYSPGIVAIVGFGSAYASIADEIIAGLREFTGEEETVVVGCELSPGQTVRVVSGALKGLEAVVTEAMPGKERVRILLNFLGREISAVVDKPSLLSEQKHPLAR
jgi:transcriptional antiterminator RfaH